MANQVYSMVLPAPIDAVWNFLDDYDYWAPLIPGYVDHVWHNDWESEWKIKSDFPLLKKVFHLKVNITQWHEPKKISFQFEGINEKFSGNGQIETKKVDRDKTLVTGKIHFLPQSAIGRFMASFLNTNNQEKSKKFSNEVAEKIREYNEF